MDEDEDPVPCFAMTNLYEAILTHDPTRSCVQVTPDMLHSFQPPEDKLPPEDPGIDIWYPSSSGKTHFHQIGLWSIMSDKPSYTGHPQPLNCQTPLDIIENPLNFEGNELLDYLTHDPDIVAELSINRSSDDLLNVSTTYLGTDLVQRTDVFNAQPSFPIILDCHTNGEFSGGGKLNILLDTGISKSYMSEAYYMSHPNLHHFPKFSIYH